jgi:circadian clock protein KaiC
MVKNRTAAHEETIRELQLRDGAIQLGDPLTKFQGVMTGVPTFLGVADQLVSGNELGR